MRRRHEVNKTVVVAGKTAEHVELTKLNTFHLRRDEYLMHAQTNRFVLGRTLRGWLNPMEFQQFTNLWYAIKRLWRGNNVPSILDLHCSIFVNRKVPRRERTKIRVRTKLNVCPLTDLFAEQLNSVFTVKPKIIEISKDREKVSEFIVVQIIEGKESRNPIFVKG